MGELTLNAGLTAASLQRRRASTGGSIEQQRRRGAYWDQVLEGWESTPAHRLWRAHSDAINGRLLRRWLPFGTGRLLKTDLFDEAVGPGPYPELAARCRDVFGVDISPAVLRAAANRYPRLEAQVADVLDLPYEDGSFDAIFSNSTLDHFESHATLRAGIVEVARTIRRGGSLLLTLDNRANPVVAVRTSRMFYPLHRLGLVPYFVGATHGPRALRTLLREAGFEVREMTAVMHCPPQLAAALRVRSSCDGTVDEHRHLQRVLRFETLEHWPTSVLTGHFVAALAIKR
jgi:SAM-dependent methyltransferase